MRIDRWFLSVAVIAGACAAALPSAGAGTPSAGTFHCSKWAAMAPKTAVDVRSCIAVKKVGSEVRISGRFEVRNRTATHHKVSYFPQAEGGSTKSPITTSMGGSKNISVAAHHTSVATGSVTTLPRAKQWISVEYILSRTKPAVRFSTTPHVKP